jgi:hypothetical protein
MRVRGERERERWREEREVGIKYYLHASKDRSK